MALICDTGVLFAAAHVLDDDHEVCARLLAEAREPIAVPSPVLVEVDWLMTRAGLQTSFDSLLADIGENLVRIVTLTHEDYARIRELTSQYRDLNLGFVDSAVIAVVERLGESKVATIDEQHFRAIRPRHRAYLSLLPADMASP